MSGININYFRYRIEEERSMLKQMVEQYGCLDTRVLRQSMKLDKLINYFNEAKYEPGYNKIERENRVSLMF